MRAGNPQMLSTPAYLLQRVGPVRCCLEFLILFSQLQSMDMECTPSVSVPFSLHTARDQVLRRTTCDTSTHDSKETRFPKRMASERVYLCYLGLKGLALGRKVRGRLCKEGKTAHRSGQARMRPHGPHFQSDSRAPDSDG